MKLGFYLLKKHVPDAAKLTRLNVLTAAVNYNSFFGKYNIEDERASAIDKLFRLYGTVFPFTGRATLINVIVK
jgi:hypothetical protein